MMTGECKRLAAASLRGKWNFGAGVTFLSQLILSIGSCALYLPFMIAALYAVHTFLKEVTVGLLYGIYVAVSLIFSGIIIMGRRKLFLCLARQEPVTADLLFDYFGSWRKMLQACKIAFFISFYTFLWSLLLVVPGIIKSFSYSMTPFILIDHPEYTVHEALDISREMMKGHKWELFLLYLRFFGWMLLTIITFGIASFWVVPYMSTSVAHFYLRLSERDELEEVSYS